MITTDDFSNFKNLIYNNQNNSAINMVVDINGIGLALPFTADLYDSTDYGVELYNNAVAGLYGPVSDYVPPPVEPVEKTARNIRNGFINATDSLVIQDYTINDEYLSTEQRDELFSTRLNFKKWPRAANWPDIPLPAVPQWILTELITKNYTLPAWPENT